MLFVRNCEGILDPSGIVLQLSVFYSYKSQQAQQIRVLFAFRNVDGGRPEPIQLGF